MCFALGHSEGPDLGIDDFHVPEIVAQRSEQQVHMVQMVVYSAEGE